VTHLILKMGAHGVLRASAHRAPNAGVRVAFRHYPSAPIPNLVNTSGTLLFAWLILICFSSQNHDISITSGAGDSLVGAFVAALCFNNNIDQAVVCGINAARMTLQSDASVSPDINKYSVGIA
jgi:sugar/nucleoside kinase (ribokinase family)